MKKFWLAIAALLMLSACGGSDSSMPVGLSTNRFLTDSIVVNDSLPFSGVRSNYTISKDGATYIIQDNVGTDAIRTASASTRLRFADVTVNLAIYDLANQIPTNSLTSLIELYVAFFNRVPDADGLAYWIEQLKAGQTLNTISEAFYSAGVQYSTLTGYSALMSNSDFVNLIYRNVLGRKDGADAGGLAYWTGQLDTGKVTRGGLVSTILASAHTFKGDSVYGWVADLLDNKIFVARKFAIDYGINFNSPAESIAKGMMIAASVTPTNTDIALTSITGSNSSSYSVAVKAVPSTKPVAISADTVYALGPYVQLDASHSYDPTSKNLTFNWTMISAPSGWGSRWGGFLNNDGQGRIGFYNYSANGPVFGNFTVSLTVSNGVNTSDPITIQIKLCCSSNDTVMNAAAFVSHLPKYSQEQAKWLFAKYLPTDWNESFKFATIYGFNYPQLDFLKGVTPGTSATEALRTTGTAAAYPSLLGGANIDAYAMNFSNVIQVPPLLAHVNYPADYAAGAAKTATIIDPYCNLNPDLNTYRKDDIGEYSLPAINAIALPPTTLRLANIKDIWSLMNPGLADGCVKDMTYAWTTTFDRLAQLNVNAIAVTPWSFVEITDAGWIIPVAGTENRVSQMSDANLAWVVNQAKARGLKVYWTHQIQGVIRTDGSFLSQTDTSTSDVQKAVAAMTTYLTERGKVLQSLGVDGVIMGAWYWVNFGSYLDSAALSTANVTMISALRKGFQGKVLYGPQSLTDMTPELSALVDGYVYNQNVSFDNNTIKNFSVNTVKTQYASGFSAFRTAAGNKAIIFDPSIQSRKGFFTDKPGYYDPFCTPLANNNCIQTTLSGDYSMQAIFTEAIFEAIAESMPGNIGGIFMPYFIDGNLLPSLNFFNIDATVRNKPAEYIYYKWFNAR